MSAAVRSIAGRMYLPTAYEFLVGSAVLFGTIGLFALCRLAALSPPDFRRARYRACQQRRDSSVRRASGRRRAAGTAICRRELTRCRPLAVTDLQSDLIGVAAMLVALLALAACDRMDKQAKDKPYAERDKASAAIARDPVAGTVARETIDEISASPVSLALLQRGRERFDIYCAPCHGRVGDGRGMIVQRGFPQPPSFHSDYAARRTGPACRRGDHQRLWRDVLLCRPRRTARPVGDRRLYPRLAGEPEHSEISALDAVEREGAAVTARSLLLLICAAAIGFIGCVVGWALAPIQTYAAWLASFDFWLGAALGCLALSMIAPLVKASPVGAPRSILTLLATSRAIPTPWRWRSACRS